MMEETIIRLEARVAALKDALFAVEEVMGIDTYAGRRVRGLLEIAEERLAKLRAMREKGKS